MDDIRNIPKLVEGLPGYKVENKTTELGGTNCNEWCQVHLKEYGFESNGPNIYI